MSKYTPPKPQTQFFFSSRNSLIRLMLGALATNRLSAILRSGESCRNLALIRH